MIPNYATKIPAELRARRQWAVAGPDKSPWTVEGRRASVTDPSTWTDYETAARKAAEWGTFPGFMLTANDPFTIIDFDVRDETPVEWVQRFQRIIAEFDSYTERSKSGRGWHTVVEGDIGKGRRRDGIEVYSKERFIICTGDVVVDRPVAARPELLATLVQEMPAPTPEVEVWGEDYPDWSLATRAVEDDGELGRLFRGDWKNRYPSQSEADLALVIRLLPYCDSPLECWRTFQLSRLGQREKAKRPDYAKSTLSVAAARLASDAALQEHGREVAASLMAGTILADPRYYRLLTDDDLMQLPPTRWLVKGIIPEVGVGAVFGSSGTFKSFLVLDLLASIANGAPWFGRKVVGAHAVYLPFEGQGGIPKRVQAWRLAHAQQNPDQATTNIRFVMDAMNLRLQADRDKLVNTLMENGWAGGVLCIDTLAQAGIGIDENTSQGMGEMVGIFQELQRRLGGVVLVVHHSGKVESAGLRGWSGLLGALDFAIKCSREADWEKFRARMVFEKVKDGESDHAYDFAMLSVSLGQDEDGDYVSSLVVDQFPTPREKLNDAEVADDDDAFVDSWVRAEMLAGKQPTGRSLEGQRESIKNQRAITQKRLRDAIARLQSSGRLEDARHGGSSRRWLRAIDVPTK